VVVRNKEKEEKKQEKKNNPAWRRFLSTELKLNKKQ